MDLFILFLNHIFLVSFLGSIFFGETIIVTVFTLAIIYSFNPFSIFFLCFFGVYLADFLWFLVGKNKLIYFFPPFKKFLSKRRIPNRIKKGFKRSPIFFMSLVKMVYGIRIISIVYLGHAGLKKSDFLRWNILPVLIGILPSAIIGILIGTGLRDIALALDTTKKILGILFLVIILSAFLNKFIRKIWCLSQKKYLQ